MPPKKKGKAKKGKAEKKEKKPAVADAEQSAFKLASVEQELASKRDRVRELAAENEDLKATRAKVEKDTHEFVAYFQKQMSAKDDELRQAKDDLHQLDREKTDDIREMKEQLRAQLTHKENEFSNIERDLRLRLKTVEEELQVLFDFKAHKQELEGQLREQAQQLVTKDLDHQRELQTLERKFLEEKTRINKENERNIASIKRQAREEAQKGLDADTRRIVTDNRRMGEELRFQLQTTDELHALKEKLEEENRTLQRELALQQEKEKEYARQGHRKGREIKDLTGQVKTLERSLAQVVRDFERSRDEMAAKHKEEIDELTVEVNGLRQLVKLKNKELKTIKGLAQTILGQRTEVEQFFLEALQQVKEEIARDRAAHRRSASAELRRQARGTRGGGGVKFPPVRPGGEAPASARSGRGTAGDRVDLSELNAKDRERVLRLLFAKINNVQTFAAHPDHSLGASAGPETRYVDVPVPMPGSAGSKRPGSGAAGGGALGHVRSRASDAAHTDEAGMKLDASATGVGGALSSMMGSFGPGTAPSHELAEDAMHGMEHTGSFGVRAGPKTAPVARGGGGDFSGSASLESPGLV